MVLFLGFFFFFFGLFFLFFGGVAPPLKRSEIGKNWGKKKKERKNSEKRSRERSLSNFCVLLITFYFSLYFKDYPPILNKKSVDNSTLSWVSCRATNNYIFQILLEVLNYLFCNRISNQYL